MKVNILGTTYLITFTNERQDKKLRECDGYCDNTIKECVVNDLTSELNDLMIKKDLNEYKKKCLRHEILHAFLFESGLGENSDWAQNEEMVDWLAYQLPKVYKVFQEAKCL